MQVRKHNMTVMLSLFHHSFPAWGQTFGRDETNEVRLNTRRL